jgi:nucleotide-binding universal stress UspA family protein
MVSIKKILLPVDFPLASLRVIHQAATLARHFHSEILILHVITPKSHAAGVPQDRREQADWDMVAAIVRQAEEQQDPSLGADLQGLEIRPRLATGDTGAIIVQTAQDEQADLIMMPSHSFTFYQFLLGSEVAKVLGENACPVWTGAHVQESGAQEFALRSVLCSVTFGPRSALTASWASQIAAEFGARLTLANVTANVESWGPGGNTVNPRFKQELVGNASTQMDKVQQALGIKAEVIIGSGDTAKVLTQAVEQTKADLLVNECYPYGGHLRTDGFAVIAAVPVPVLSV